MGMKNNYEIRGDFTAIFLNRRDGSVIETIIDTTDLDRAKEFPGKWYADWNKPLRNFYVGGSLKRTSIKLHRWIMQPSEKNVIDHINHDTLDNTRNNLREVSQKVNSQNRNGSHRTNKLGIRGVHWHKAAQKYVAQICCNKQVIHLGSFVDLEEAKKVVVEAREQYFGELI